LPCYYARTLWIIGGVARDFTANHFVHILVCDFHHDEGFEAKIILSHWLKVESCGLAQQMKNVAVKKSRRVEEKIF